jgi:hypothetical protein
MVGATEGCTGEGLWQAAGQAWPSGSRIWAEEVCREWGRAVVRGYVRLLCGLCGEWWGRGGGGVLGAGGEVVVGSRRVSRAPGGDASTVCRSSIVSRQG